MIVPKPFNILRRPADLVGSWSQRPDRLRLCHLRVHGRLLLGADEYLTLTKPTTLSKIDSACCRALSGAVNQETVAAVPPVIISALNQDIVNGSVNRLIVSAAIRTAAAIGTTVLTAAKVPAACPSKR